MNKINLTIYGLILFFILLIGLYFLQKGSTLVKVNEGFNSTPTVSPSPVTTSLSTTLPSTTLPGYYLTFQYDNMTYYLQEPTAVNDANMNYTPNINDATTFNIHNPETKTRYFTIVNPKNQAGGPNKPFSLVIFFGDVMLTDISNLQSQITAGHVNSYTSTGPIRYQLKGFQSPKTWLFITPTLTTASHGSTISPAPPNVPSGYTLKSDWDQYFGNAVGGDYITYQGNTLVLEKNGSLLLLEGNSPTGTNIIWSFDSGMQDGNATSGWDSSENRYLIKLNGNEIWAAPPRSCPAPTAKFMVGWNNLYIQDSFLNLSGYSNTPVWQSNNPSCFSSYPSNTSPSSIVSPASSGSGGSPYTPSTSSTPTSSTPSPSPTVSPAPVTPHHHGSTVSPAPVTHSPSGSSPHTYTHCHTHSDPNHSHTPSNSINVVVSKYTKNIGT